LKAIIIAAGMGVRLDPLTNNKPKCMLKIKEKTILQYQLDAFYANSITDISVIKGYKKEQIKYSGIKYYINNNYINNNILNSLFYAEDEMNESFIGSYSDILFESNIVGRLIKEKEDITIVVDTEWKDRYEGRTMHPIEEAEKVILNGENVVDIGKIVSSNKNIDGEFIGMLKCSKRGAKIFKEYFHKAKKEFYGKSFIRSKSFSQGYLTDFIRYLVDNGIKVSCMTIRHGWIEIDTVQDLERAEKEWKLEEKINE